MPSHQKKKKKNTGFRHRTFAYFSTLSHFTPFPPQKKQTNFKSPRKLLNASLIHTLIGYQDVFSNLNNLRELVVVCAFPCLYIQYPMPMSTSKGDFHEFGFKVGIVFHFFRGWTDALMARGVFFFFFF